MPIHVFRCPECNKVLDKIRKMSDNDVVFCDCHSEGDAPIKMQQVYGTPAPMQWKCAKGF